MRKCSNYQNLIGRPELKQSLQELVQKDYDRVIVFSGPQGTDKALVANAYISHLLCQQPGEDGACKGCNSCRYLEQGNHPDYLELVPEKKNKFIPIDEVREKVHAEVNLLPQLGNKKVWYLDGNALQEGSQNALLKVLEEPPEYAYFVLTIDNINKLLPTLRSRAVEVKVPVLNSKELLAFLRAEGIEDPEQLNLALNFSSGLPELALDLAENPDLNQERKGFLNWLQVFVKQNPAGVLLDSLDFWAEYKNDIDIALMFVESFIRDLSILSADPDFPKEKLLNTDLYTELDNFLRANKLKNENFTRALSILNQAYERLQANGNFDIVMTAMLLQLRTVLNPK